MAAVTVTEAARSAGGLRAAGVRPAGLRFCCLPDMIARVIRDTIVLLWRACLLRVAQGLRVKNLHTGI